jgi:hypothetical protein
MPHWTTASTLHAVWTYLIWFRPIDAGERNDVFRVLIGPLRPFTDLLHGPDDLLTLPGSHPEEGRAELAFRLNPMIPAAHPDVEAGRPATIVHQPDPHGLPTLRVLAGCLLPAGTGLTQCDDVAQTRELVRARRGTCRGWPEEQAVASAGGIRPGTPG